MGALRRWWKRLWCEHTKGYEIVSTQRKTCCGLEDVNTARCICCGQPKDYCVGY